MIQTNTLSERQTQIIGAALDIIAEMGIHNLTVKTLAARVNFTEGALYRHFKSKNDILAGIAELFRATSNQVLETIVNSSLTGIGKIKTFVMERSRQFAEYPNLVQVMFSDEIFKGNVPLREKVHETMRDHHNMLSQAIQEGRECGAIRSDIPPQHLFTVIMGAQRLLVTRWKLSACAFNLNEEAAQLWTSLEKLLSPGK